MKKSFLSLFLAFAVLMSLTSAVYAAESGNCGVGGTGTNAAYTLDDSKMLTITGTGATDIHSSSLGIDRKDIRGVIIGDGITSISEFSFDRFFALNVVYLPASLQNIPYRSFQLDHDILEIYYGGTEAEWNQKLSDTFPDELKGKIMHYQASPSDVTGPPAPNNPLYTIDAVNGKTTFHINKHLSIWPSWFNNGYTEFMVEIELYNPSNTLIASKSSSVSMTAATMDVTVDVDFNYILHVGDYIKVDTHVFKP